MQNLTDIGHAKVIKDLDPTGLGIQLDLDKRRGQRGHDTLLGQLILGSRHQPCALDHIGRHLGQALESRVEFMAIIFAAKLDGLFRCLGKTDGIRPAFTDDALILEIVVFGLTTHHGGANFE